MLDCSNTFQRLCSVLKTEQRDCSIAFCFSSLHLNHDHTVLELICSLISSLARFVNLRICFGDHVSATDLSNLAYVVRSF